LPLALELAAARLDVLPLSTLARRLDDRLHLLASEAPDLPERQRSLEAAIGWSYDLLSEAEQRVFRCLGVFVGGVTADAIASVVGATASPEEASVAGDDRNALKRLVSLAEKSLLLPARSDEMEAGADKEGEGPEPAFGMLETVRAYARERLDAAGELDAASRAHACYFLALAERADAQLRGHDQQAWFFRLDRSRTTCARPSAGRSIKPAETAQTWPPSVRQGCDWRRRWATSGTCAATIQRACAGWRRRWPARCTRHRGRTRRRQGIEWTRLRAPAR